VNHARVLIQGVSPLSFSKHYSENEVPKKTKELHDEYERRTWRHRMHVNADGFVEIPAMAFANAIKESVKRLKIQVKGKGRVEYTKYFEAGVMVTEPLTLPIKAENVPCDEQYVPSNGQRGGGKRVTKFFPRIDKWGGAVSFWIIDDQINEDVFTQAITSAGLLVGIGRFRPERSGFYGRFKIERVNWLENVSLDGAAA
jgi:hypothetical protein